MREVESILASDPIAREEFEALAATDVKWRACARSASFHPTVDLPVVKEEAISLRAIATFVVLLIVMQFFLEQLDVLALTVALNAAAFALVLIGVVFLVKNQKALA
jgi:hypothetical protein